MDLCFVNDGMDTHHHKGDVTARTISPERAFLFARLRIGGNSVRKKGGPTQGRLNLTNHHYKEHR